MNTVKRNEESFKETSKIYLIMMSFYALADKLYGSIYIAFMRSRDMSMLSITRLFSIQQILLAIFDYPTGNISDRIGRKRIASYGFIVRGISMVIFGLVSSFSGFLFSMVLTALGFALITGAPSAWFIDHMISDGVYDRRSDILPKIQAATNLFSVLAGLISYVLLGFDIRLPLIISGVICIGTGIYSLNAGTDNYGNSEEKHLISAMKTNLKNFVQDKKLIAIVIKNMLNRISFFAFVLYWQVHATEIVGLEIKYMAVISATLMFIMMLGNYFASQTTKVMTSFNSSIFGIIINASGFLVFYLFKSIPAFIIGAFLIEFGIGLIVSSNSIWTNDYVGSEVRATYTSIFSSVEAVCGFFIVNGLGLLSEKFGINSIWIISIIALLAEGLLIYIFSVKYSHEGIIH